MNRVVFSSCKLKADRVSGARLCRCLAHETGSSLLIVLTVGSAAAVAAALWLSTSWLPVQLADHRLHDVQARLNARSGLWVALADSDDNSANSTPAPSSLASFLSAGIGKEVLPNSLRRFRPTLDPAMGSWTLHDSATEFEKILRSTGCFRTSAHISVAVQRGVVARNCDTLLFYRRRWSSNAIPGRSEGAVAVEQDYVAANPRDTGWWQRRFQVNDSILESIDSAERAEIQMIRTASTVSKNAEVLTEISAEIVPDMVTGNLVIAGNNGRLRWHAHRTIRVAGDMQITGTVDLKDLRFVVAGTAKLWGTSLMEDVDIVCGQTVFFGDEITACKVHFRGRVIGFGPIEICRNTIIDKGSMILRFGKPDEAGELRRPKKYAPIFSVYIRDKAKVCGTVIVLSNAGIQTFPGAQTEGVLWVTKGCIRHQGAHAGIMIAWNLADGMDARIKGTIGPCSDIGSQYVPYYMGSPAVVSWREE